MRDVLDLRETTTPWPPLLGDEALAGPLRNVRQVLDAVSIQTGVSVTDMLSPRSGLDRWIARSLTAYLCRELLTHYSLPAIGRQLHRDHTTVLHNWRRWQQRRQRADMRRLENAVRQRLGVD
jgi:chromosomal replication initiation ATPase DnaA